MVDTQKLAYTLAATISSAGVAGGVPIGASVATGAVDASGYPASATSGQQQTTLPQVTTVTDTYSKAETDAKLALAAEKAGRVSDGLSAKLDRVLDAITTAGEKTDARVAALTEKVGDVMDDNKSTRRITLVTVVVSVIAAVAAIYAAQANNIAAMQVGIESTRDAIAATAPAVTP